MQQVEQGRFFIIAGPCVIESRDVCLKIARHIKSLCDEHGLPYIFKSSYIKANRLSASSYTGPGLDLGLEVLKEVRETLNIPVLTDVHETSEIGPVAEVADVLQIPAFLSRQTELVARAAATGKWINIKKGQFLAPEDMSPIAAKAKSKKVMLTERGSTFGYRNLVVDFRSLLIMKETGCPVVFDATHSLQLPGAGAGVSTGQPKYIIPMAKAAAAVGIDGLFVETHPDPDGALSDAGAMLRLEQMKDLLDAVVKTRKANT